MHSLQKMSFSVLLCGVLVVSSILFAPTDSLGALPKKKLEIIIGGENFCKDDKDCAGDSFCNMTSHICIICPPPFEWVGGTQCVCPSGTVPNADNTDCVECLDDSDCTTLKEATSWYCDTGTNMCIHCPSPKEWHADTNTCECPSGTHIVRDSCICDNPNKTLVDGLCQCQIDQKSCSSSDFMGEINCACCPDDKPVWNKASGELAQCVSCADVDATKTYYNSVTKTCEECLIDEHCENEEVCSVDKTCVCELDKDSCSNTDFAETKCACCPTDKPKWDNVSGTCKACSEIDATKPYYNSDTKTCEECLTDEDCENEKVCSVDKTCICEMTGTECTLSDFNATQCMCCPAETPVYDAATGTCKTCEEMHPEWAETGTAYDITTKQCWPYCGKEEFGVVMLVDRSGSTAENGIGTKTRDEITAALKALNIPSNMNVAYYQEHVCQSSENSIFNRITVSSCDEGDADCTTALRPNKILSYGVHSRASINAAIENDSLYVLPSNILCLWQNGVQVCQAGNTSFYGPLIELDQICSNSDGDIKQKFIMIMWTDGVISCVDGMMEKINNIKTNCPGSKFYFVGRPGAVNKLSSVTDTQFDLVSKEESDYPIDYVKILNADIEQNGCIVPEKDKTVE